MNDPASRPRRTAGTVHRYALVLAAAGLALAPLGWLGTRRSEPMRPEPAPQVAADATEPVDARTALREGNRRLRAGDPERAIAAWEAGWLGGGSGEEAALAYNLATTAHRLGRRPEAVLWYRRAERAGAGDAWLTENLALARAELGAGRLAAGGAGGWLAARPAALPALAAALSWLAAGLLAAGLLAGRGHAPAAGSAAVAPADRARHARRLHAAGLAAGAVALAAWAAGALIAAGAPRPAVLLAVCPAADGELAAGSELWVRPAESGGWRIAGEPRGTVCPPESVGLLE